MFSFSFPFEHLPYRLIGERQICIYFYFLSKIKQRTIHPKQKYTQHIHGDSWYIVHVVDTKASTFLLDVTFHDKKLIHCCPPPNKMNTKFQMYMYCISNFKPPLTTVCSSHLSTLIVFNTFTFFIEENTVEIRVTPNCPSILYNQTSHTWLPRLGGRLWEMVTYESNFCH